MTQHRQIRNIALGFVLRGDRVLVSFGEDRLRGSRYCRAVGGGIEFGETAEQALRREFQEELAVDLEEVRLIGVLENLFEHEGQFGHEIVHLFLAESAQLSQTELEQPLRILDTGETAGWLSVGEFDEAKLPLYPPKGYQLLLAEMRRPSA